MPKTTVLSELAEIDAPPEIASIYTELRELSGTPMVALIWRHLATVPDALPKVWTVLQPLFAAGLVQEAAWRSANAAVQAPAASVTQATLRAAGLDAQAQASFVRVLDAYNRANPINFLAVRLLLRAIHGEGRQQILPKRNWAPPPAIEQLPPMGAVAAFSDSQRRLINSLSSSNRIDRSLVVPSLYRHLVGWPGLISLVHAELAPRFETGEVGRMVAAVTDAIEAEAARLIVHMSEPGDLLHQDPIIDALTSFSLLIPEMIVVGLLLRRGLEHE